MRKKKKRSEERKYFDRLLSEALLKDLDYSDAGKAHDFIELHGPDSKIVLYAIHWDETRVLVETLEASHADPDFRPDKKYRVQHRVDISTYHKMSLLGTGDPTVPVVSEKTRAEILARLVEIACLDFGDDPAMWRRWYKAWDEDDFFPPVPR